MDNEIWLPILETGGQYDVSDLGRFRNSTTKCVLRLSLDKKGYSRITLWYENKIRRTRSCHRIVAEAFIPNPENKPEVNHKDFNKTNNRIENLEWCTALENRRHYYENKFVGKISDDDILFIRKNISTIGMKALANKFSVNQGYILSIANGVCKWWVHPEFIRDKKYSNPIPIIEYDLSGKETARYTSASQASKKRKISLGHIRRVLTGERKTFKGSIFKYADPELAIKLNKKTKKEFKIHQYDLDGNYISSFYNPNHAARETGINKHLIRDVITGRQKKTHGYIFSVQFFG